MEPIRLWLGTSNGWLVPAARGVVLVDTGPAGTGWRLLLRGLKRRGLSPAQVKLIMITHAHFDHAGSLGKIAALTGAPVLVHGAEAPLLSTGRAVIPPGATPYGRVIHRVGRIAARLGVLDFPPYPQAVPLLVGDCVDNGASQLEAVGLVGRIIHTPGHTAGSISLLCDNGDAFVGDIAANHFPLGRGPILPPFFGDRAVLLGSWRTLLEQGAQRIHPGHGAAFAAERLRKWLGG